MALKTNKMVFIKSAEEIKKIRAAGKILSAVAREILKQIQEGTNLKDLDRLTQKLIVQAGGKPAFLGYRPHGSQSVYPFSICTSVNSVVVHGRPTDYKLRSGDVLKLDMGVLYENYYADAAWTVGIGKISSEAEKLIKITREALEKGLKECKPGKTLGDIGFAIGSFVRKNGFYPVKGLTGHGIGKDLHEDPNVFNDGKKGEGIALKPGMVLAIEPMIAIGTPEVIQADDDSYITADGSLAAHFEHTVVITEDGYEALTI